MAIKISKEKISTFVGNVFPIWVMSDDEDLKKKRVRWSVSGDAVMVRDFGGAWHASFTYGILLTAMKPGSVTVTAVVDDMKFTAVVEVRERVHDESSDKLNYYLGDMHDHTTLIHEHDLFLERETDFPYQYINTIKEEGLLDFAVISDHSDVLNSRDFFRGFTDTELSEPMDMVIFPGSESEINNYEYDRYGNMHKFAGEIVIVNSSTYFYSKTHEEFIREFRESPFVIGTLAHPQVVGAPSQSGLWNFRLDKYNSEGFRRLIKMVELSCGAAPHILNEYVYSTALDNGFRVGCTCSTDAHDSWSFNNWPGKTVVMASSKTKEAILDALLSGRAYASESGKVKIAYSVNGKFAPCDLELTNKYSFKVDLSYFEGDEKARIVKCDVISDYGKSVKTITADDLSHFEFEIESDSARYFYLRLVDECGRRTWSVPTYLGRPTDAPDSSEPTPIAKAKMTVTDLLGAKNTEILINDKPREVWQSELGKAELVFDIGEEKAVSAIGHIAPEVHADRFAATGLGSTQLQARFARDFVISASLDGVNYTEVKNGLFRNFGGEELIRFEPTRARFIKLSVKNTVGKCSDWTKYENEPLEISEITIFE